MKSAAGFFHILKLGFCEPAGAKTLNNSVLNVEKLRVRRRRLTFEDVQHGVVSQPVFDTVAPAGSQKPDFKIEQIRLLTPFVSTTQEVWFDPGRPAAGNGRRSAPRAAAGTNRKAAESPCPDARAVAAVPGSRKGPPCLAGG